MLTAYTGNAITYDNSGNPLSMNGWNFTWQGGRQLAGMTNGTTTLSFAYNDSGLRTTKTVGGVTHTYTYQGSALIADVTATDALYFHYDQNGSVLGFTYDNGTTTAEYYYVKNLQGDVLGILDASGSLVASYSYDAWGNALSVGGSNSALTNRNPIRYRGYYYDIEMGFYYLSSRYYDPEIRRWINTDGYTSTGQGILGTNMFSYCGNNPVNRVDYTGQFWSEIWEFAKTAVSEIGKAMGRMSPAYAGLGGAAAGDGPLPFGDVVAVAGAAFLTVGTIGYGVYQAAQAADISPPKAKEKAETVVNPKEPNDPVIFPVDPNSFNPVGLVKVPRAGTKNGALISWMDPVTNIEVFRWDENLNYSNGPHYHIYGTGHYYPNTIVPEPYATIYFPFR